MCFTKLSNLWSFRELSGSAGGHCTRVAAAHSGGSAGDVSMERSGRGGKLGRSDAMTVGLELTIPI